MKNKIFAGQSLFEVVIAVGISALIITGIVAAALNSIQNSSYARDKNLATNYVQETMEWLRKVRDVSGANFNTAATASINDPARVYCLDANPLPASIPTSRFVSLTNCLNSPLGTTKFARFVFFLNCSPDCPQNVVRATSVVIWQDSKGNHEVTSTTDLSVK